MDEAHWPWCLLWHGWLPGVDGASPWAADASEGAWYMVEVALGRYSSNLLAGWGPSDGYGVVEVASSMPGHPNVWADGSLVLDRVTGMSDSGAGCFSHSPEDCWNGVSGVMLIMFVLRGVFSLVEAFVLFLGLCSLFRELRCGVSFFLCRLLLLFIWVLTTWVWFDMLGVFLMVVLVLFFSSLSRMVIFSCLLIRCFVLEVVKRFGLPRTRVTLIKGWFLTVGLGKSTG